jgi:hypothetical protein
MRRVLSSCSLSIVLACLAVASGATDAAAHTRSQSRSTWWIEDGHATAVFTVAALEVTRLGEIAFTDLPLIYADHLRDTVHVRAAGVVCDASSAATVLPAERGFARVELAFDCDGGADWVLEITSFLSVASSHLHLADVRQPGQPPRDYLFSDAARRRRFESEPRAWATGESVDAFVEYVSVGIEHIATGWDHIAFVAVLVLLCAGVREITAAISGFTVGHSITLAAATLGAVEPNPSAVEALIGYTIAVAAFECAAINSATALRMAITSAAVGAIGVVACVAAGNAATAVAIGGVMLFSFCYLLGRGQSPRPARARILLTTVFGLIHGLGFASAFIDMNLPVGRLTRALLGFNVGVEIGQLAIVVAMLLIAALAARALPPNARVFAHTALNSVLAGLGVFWLVTRCLV